MTVYELIQELAYFKADTPVFVTNRVKIVIDG